MAARCAQQLGGRGRLRCHAHLRLQHGTQLARLLKAGGWGWGWRFGLGLAASAAWFGTQLGGLLLERAQVGVERRAILSSHAVRAQCRALHAH